MKYQFQIDNRPAGPIRSKAQDAIRDAVQEGYATWIAGEGAVMDQQASIARIEEKDKTK